MTKQNFDQLNQPIFQGLKDLVKIIPKNKYRVFGSIIPSSLDKEYKKIGDIDVFCEEKVKKQIIKKFKGLRYQVSSVWGFGNALRVIPIRFTKGKVQIDIFFGSQNSKKRSCQSLVSFIAFILIRFTGMFFIRSKIG